MAEKDIKITKAKDIPFSYFGSGVKNTLACTSGNVPKKEEFIKEENTETEKENFPSKSLNKVLALSEKTVSISLDAKDFFKDKFSCFFEDAFNKLKNAVKKISLNFAVSMVMMILTVIFTACFCSVSYKVTVLGAEIGIIDKKSDFKTIVDEINAEFSSYGETDFTICDEPKFTPELILKGRSTDKREFKERLKSTQDYMIPAYSIMVDGEVVFALASDELAKDTLQEHAKSLTDENENAELTFLSDVEISHIFVPKTMLKTKESGLMMLKEGKHTHYTAKEGDTIESISQKHNISIETLLLSNTIYEGENIEGKIFDIYTGEPVISYKTVLYLCETQNLPHETVTEKDSSKYEGTTHIKQEGKDGKKEVKAYITKVNGIETERDIISEIIVSDPISQIEVIGTKELPTPIGTGNFSVPANGQLSSRYGSRWGRNHDGIDFSANEGTPIYAADNGTVIYSQFNDGGYGNLIKIDHANGYITYYAHCSKLVAKEGDIVAKGDLIGYVGNTGRSTGSHLHFEVRKDGVPCDPMEFIN